MVCGQYFNNEIKKKISVLFFKQYILFKYNKNIYFKDFLEIFYIYTYTHFVIVSNIKSSNQKWAKQPKFAGPTVWILKLLWKHWDTVRL